MEQTTITTHETESEQEEGFDWDTYANERAAEEDNLDYGRLVIEDWNSAGRFGW